MNKIMAIRVARGVGVVHGLLRTSNTEPFELIYNYCLGGFARETPDVVWVSLCSATNPDRAYWIDDATGAVITCKHCLKAIKKLEEDDGNTR